MSTATNTSWVAVAPKHDAHSPFPPAANCSVCTTPIAFSHFSHWACRLFSARGQIRMHGDARVVFRAWGLRAEGGACSGLWALGSSLPMPWPLRSASRWDVPAGELTELQWLALSSPKDPMSANKTVWHWCFAEFAAPITTSCRSSPANRLWVSGVVVPVCYWPPTLERDLFHLPSSGVSLSRGLPLAIFSPSGRS